jgi:hypothetical protein
MTERTGVAEDLAIPVLGYTYPWDFEPAGAGGRLARRLGLDSVAIAAHYHAVRARTPLHGTRFLVDATNAAAYFRLRDEAWAGSALAPTEPSWVGPGSFEHACRQAHRLGLTVFAWLALTHDATVGAAHPDMAVRDVFGDLRPYALCPAQPGVVEFCARLATEAALCGAPAAPEDRPDGLVLEAVSALGVVHAVAHDKSRLDQRAEADKALLSFCFCPRCAAAYERAGVDTTVLRAAMCAALRAGGDAAAALLESAREELAVLWRVRGEHVRALLASVAGAVREARPGLPIQVHISPRPWDFGAAGTPPAVAEDADELVCWLTAEDDETSAGEMIAAVAAGTARVAVVIESTHPSWRSRVARGRMLAAVRAAGATGVHLYNPSLFDENELDLIAGALDEARAPGGPLRGRTAARSLSIGKQPS